ncbi:MAG TPA: hypothetical protein VNG53_06870 [Bacteroidia bacterium]|nr:hypothetical protein [Bacteroidia bacterium]
MKRQNNKKKINYKGPFPNNPNLGFQTVKKSMRTEIDGPTVDAFSKMDSTTDTDNDTKEAPRKTKRPTKERKSRKTISTEFILGIVFTGLITIGSAIVGVFIYNHSNRLTSIERDIFYLNKDADNQNVQMEKISDKTNKNGEKIDLLNQKIDLQSQKTK